MASVKVGVVGLGYFSQFHLKAWHSIKGATLVGVTDLDRNKASTIGKQYGCSGFTDISQMLAAHPVDIVDIVAPPIAHKAIVQRVAAPNRLIICQKPFCESLEQAQAMVDFADSVNSRLIIHENFRFQPWFRALKEQLDATLLGTVFQCRFSLRTGDGRGQDAYLNRQPSFQSMPRFLFHETGVHYVDVFRWLFGEVVSVYADTRRLNPAIRGEDAGVFILDHQSGTQSIFDGNRLMDHATDNTRRTLGEMTIEGEAGTVRLDGYGNLYFRAFGERDSSELPVNQPIDETSFGGGCVTALIEHAVQAYTTHGVYENEAKDYLTVMRTVEAAYKSAASHTKIVMDHA